MRAKADSAKYFSNDLAGEVFGADNKRDSDQTAAVNQFDEVSAEFTDTATEGKPLNFSRSDFAGTFPTAPTDADITAEDYIKTAIESVYDYAEKDNRNNKGILTNSEMTSMARICDSIESGECV